jgi:quercetin dioxygenase-like cupin family protein
MTERPSAVPTLQVENDFAIVTEWRFAPGAQTGWHRHEYNYVVVPSQSGRLLIETKDGERHAELTHGVAYAREAGVEHNVVNANHFEFAFVEIEFKDRPLKQG